MDQVIHPDADGPAESCLVQAWLLKKVHRRAQRILYGRLRVSPHEEQEKGTCSLRMRGGSTWFRSPCSLGYFVMQGLTRRSGKT